MAGLQRVLDKLPCKQPSPVLTAPGAGEESPAISVGLDILFAPERGTCTVQWPRPHSMPEISSARTTPAIAEIASRVEGTNRRMSAALPPTLPWPGGSGSIRVHKQEQHAEVAPFGMTTLQQHRGPVALDRTNNRHPLGVNTQKSAQAASSWWHHRAQARLSCSA